MYWSASPAPAGELLVGVATVFDEDGSVPRPRTLAAIGIAWPLAILAVVAVTVAAVARALWRNSWD